MTLLQGISEQSVKSNSALNKIKSIKTSADESLKKIRGKKWSKPLGKTLEHTGKIVTMIGKVVPGVVPIVGVPIGSVLCILGGALTMGANLLNPKPNLKDLQKDINEMKQELKSITEKDEERKAILEETLREEIKEMEKKIATPMSEIRSDLKLIQCEMLEVKKVVQDRNDQIEKELSEIKDKIMQHCKPKPCRAYRELPVSQFSQGKPCFHYREPLFSLQGSVFITGISL